MEIEELEELRKKAKNSFSIAIAVSIFCVLVLVFAIQYFIFVAVFFSVAITIPIVYGLNYKSKFISRFKEICVLQSLKSAFCDLTYEPEKGLDESVIESTGIINMKGIHMMSNDYISGNYKNTQVVQADVNMERIKSTVEGKTQYIYIFKGRWMIFEFNKDFKASVIVKQEGFSNPKFSDSNFKTKYKKIEMEDQEFNNNFEIYTQDEEEAFYILTPSLMEKIKNLANKILGKLLLCFVDNKLHIAVENNCDSFEYGSIFMEVDKEKINKGISQDIKLITGFIDELSLDNDLFRREVQ